MIRLSIRLLLLLILPFAGQAQKLKKADKSVIAALQSHIRYLADDRLEGRRTGTPGEKLAVEYIAAEFQKAGLAPRGTDGFFQPFTVNEGRQVNPGSHFILNDNDLKLNTDYFPFGFSRNASVESATAIALRESGSVWFWDMKEEMLGSKSNPHFDAQEIIRSKAKEVAGKGATGLVVFNTSGMEDGLKFNGKEKIELSTIPVVYLSAAAAKKHLTSESALLDIKLKVDIGDKLRSGTNVAGYIDNSAPVTIILGAHFDHLGYGEDGNSRNTGNAAIHNGADDNASGTAALIELGRMLKQSALRGSNFLFVAFSGEELGLFGSKYFAENPTIDMSGANYMINMDMVGRLNDSTRALTIGGYGTSPSWGQLIGTGGKEPKGYFYIKLDSSGTGPSDHTSFYRKNVPVLFFFTGLHTDYHTPTDDFDKINFVGELMIIKYIMNLIERTNKGARLVFTKTREQVVSTNSRFKVSLGIMPDYTYTGEGVRADGVIDGKPAMKAGVKTGDIILQIGDFPTHGMESYMQTLGKFNKGDKTKIRLKRGAEVLELNLEF